MTGFEPWVSKKTEFRAMISVAFRSRGVAKGAVEREDSCVVPSGGLVGAGEEKTRKNGLTYTPYFLPRPIVDWDPNGIPRFCARRIDPGQLQNCVHTHYKGLTEHAGGLNKDGNAPNSEITTVILQNHRSTYMIMIWGMHITSYLQNWKFTHHTKALKSTSSFSL